MATPDLNPRFFHPFIYLPFYLSACPPCSLLPFHCILYPSNIYYVHASTHLCIYQFFLCHQSPGPSPPAVLNYSGSQCHQQGHLLFQTDPQSPQLLTCRWIETLSFHRRTSLKHSERSGKECGWTELYCLDSPIWFGLWSEARREGR